MREEKHKGEEMGKKGRVRELGEAGDEHSLSARQPHAGHVSLQQLCQLNASGAASD